MDDQQCSKPRQLRHGFTQILFGDIRKFINAGMNQKTLEADHAGVPKL